MALSGHGIPATPHGPVRRSAPPLFPPIVRRTEMVPHIGGPVNTVVAGKGSAATQGDLWGARALDWARYQEPVMQPLYERALDVAGIAGGTRLLDVGCGAGLFCR